MRKNENKIVLFESSDKTVVLDVIINKETVWLTQAQMAALFDVNRSVITKHINNVFSEKEADEKSNVQKMHIPNSDKLVKQYSLDIIISVGYRVKSLRGIEFRRWANSVLKQFILQGYAVNQKRLQTLGTVLKLMKRTEEKLDTGQVLSVIERYAEALQLLDNYDHQTLKRPDGSAATYILSYAECRKIIDAMSFGNSSTIFGKEKDESFKGSIGNIYQSFDGRELYPTLEEKAANLLYFITKNHSFVDGNKRIAATIFLYFLDKNGVLFDGDKKLIDGHALAALTILIAESKPEEKETMISVIMNCIV